MSRIGITKTLIPTTGFLVAQLLPAAGAAVSTGKVVTGDYSKARVYFGYISLNASSQLSVQIKVSAVRGGTMFPDGPAVLTAVGASNKFFFIDVDVSNACEVQAELSEVGNTASQGTVYSSLMLARN